MTHHTRKLAVSIFKHERSLIPLRSAAVGWDKIVALHKNRTCRHDKAGPMIGGYALQGNRCNANVAHRSLIQLDIDSTTEKTAPTIQELRDHIIPYEWVAASTHGHMPEQGVNKYRITMLPDRDIMQHEHRHVLEALNDLLGGALDKNAWQWSQAFYLPSCPPDNEKDAFFEHNIGVALPVDEFLRSYGAGTSRAVRGIAVGFEALS